MISAERIVSLMLGEADEAPANSGGLVQPSDVALPVLNKWKDRRVHGKPVEDYAVHNSGVMYSDYHQGAGIAFTRWDAVEVGVGINPYEAMNDALDNLGFHGWDVRNIKNEFDPNAGDVVAAEVLANNPEAANEEGDVDTDGCYNYVEVYVKGISVEE